MTDLAQVRRKLAQGELTPVLRDLDALLKLTPDNLEALYMQAVALRYTGQYDHALGTLQHLLKLAPAHARAHQEQGHVYRDAGAIDDALRAYARAYELNPALDACLRESVRLLVSSGRTQHAQALQTQLDQLLALPQPLRATMDLMAQNQLLKAETNCRKYLEQHPTDIDAMRMLADIGSRLGVLEDAEFLLESAVAFAPENLPLRIEYVQILRKRQKFEAALAQAVSLLQQYPNNLQVKSICAIEYMQTGDYTQALALLDEVLSVVPGDARTLVTRGHALKTSGQSAAAVACYRQAATAQPQHGESYYALANLKTYRFEAADIAHMQALLKGTDLATADRVYLHFALAKAYEDSAQYAEAFEHYAQGNGLKKTQSRYDADRMHQELQATQRVCDRHFFANRQGTGAQSPAPIFIVGLPRAGSTLLEQILSSHSQVDGTLELPNIPSLAQKLRRRGSKGGYPSCLSALTAQECAEFGQTYLEDTQIHRAGAPFFIDKMPNNFRHIGLIKMILPNAKIIDARRDAMACCFSGYKQLFAEGQEFSYDLTDIGRYYRDYVVLMDHWNAVLPGFVHRVQHEDVVQDLETAVRQMLNFCGLRFEPNCLKFYETQRNIRTPSSEQVRQPIFSSALDQWRHFEPWLEPLRNALQDNYAV